MEVGRVNKLPHYAVHGDKTCMYMWMNDGKRYGSSGWIKGKIAFSLWHELEAAFKKNKVEYIELFNERFKQQLSRNLR